MKWRVGIQGAAGDLEHLARRFTKEPIQIDNDVDGHFLELDSFSGLTEASDVLAEGERVIKLLSGVVKLRRNSFEPLKAGHVTRVHPDGRRDAFVFIRASLTMRAELGEPTVTVSGPGPRPPAPPDPSVELASLGLKDRAVEDALRLFAHDASDWVGLYRLYEVIEADAGGRTDVVSKGWSTDADIRRFKHTANSRSAIGDLARHGSESTQPPKNPMRFEEADAFVKGILQAWLKEKNPFIT